MKKIFTLLLPLSFVGLAHSLACSLPKPSTAKISTVTSCSATMTWNNISGAAYYSVKYKKADDDDWIVLPDHVVGTTFTFTGLASSTSYSFGVASYCSDNSTAGFKQCKKTTKVCPSPTNISTTGVKGTEATITWVPACGAFVFNVRYRKTGVSAWTDINNVAGAAYTISGLKPLTGYEASVQSNCETESSSWPTKVTFTTGAPPPVKPNILLIMEDDGRYDSYQPNGGPAFFQSPSINRIANEGVNFKYAFPTTSQCAPSRVSIYTGLYAHHNGALDNNTRMNDSLPLVQQILKDNGYYTGFVGKYGQFQGQPTGFDWWATSEGNIYVDAIYSVNDSPDTMIPGHITDVYEDMALTFLNSVPANKPFMLMYFTRIPHGPTIPRVQEQNLYLTESMPYPDNAFKYPSNYPSYFYNTHNWGYDVEATDSMRLIEFQTLAGLEDNVATFLSFLEQKGILDSTMVIFTSDNGYLKGEHKLEAKQIAQEESIRVPLFIRYPYWFPAGTVVTNEMAANIDIPLTMLHAAGIPETFDMDGLSLKKLYDQTVQRNYFFYQYAGEAGSPTIRAIRSNQYKYVKHYCTNVTEEFYDLSTDPKENVNLINNASFNSLISSYRFKLDSFRTAVGDYTPVNVGCSLSNPQFTKEGDDEHESVNDRILRLWPNPATDYFLVNFNEAGNSEDITIDVSNVIGQRVYYKEIQATDVLSAWVPCADWPSQVYTVTLRKGGMTYTRKIIAGQ